MLTILENTALAGPCEGDRCARSLLALYAGRKERTLMARNIG
jgi:hypothetical protein